MVEFEIKDYDTLARWFELAFAGKESKNISDLDKKTFWKLTFLAEDKIKQERMEKTEED